MRTSRRKDIERRCQIRLFTMIPARGAFAEVAPCPPLAARVLCVEARGAARKRGARRWCFAAVARYALFCRLPLMSASFRFFAA